MAKIELAPIVTSARGRLGEMVFSGQGGVDFVRQFVPPLNVNSIPQQRTRRIIARGSEVWGRLQVAYHALGFPADNLFQFSWELYVQKRKNTGYGAFMESYYADASTGGRGVDVRLIKGNGGFHSPESVLFRLGSLPNEVIITVESPQYIQDRFAASDILVYLVRSYNPDGPVPIDNRFITYRILSNVDQGTTYGISLQPLSGVPFQRNNVVFGASMIYRVSDGGRILGFSTAIQGFSQ